MKYAALLLCALALPGCAAPEIRYISRPLPIPVAPVLPALTPADVSCLSPDAWRRLVERDTLRRQYAEELEAILESTHEGRSR